MGERTGQLLAAHFGEMSELAEASAEELTNVHEIGPKIAEGVREFFSESANRKLIERLRAVGVNMKEERAAVLDAKFAGMTFVFTGTLATRSRRGSGSPRGGARREGGNVREQKDELRGGRGRPGIEIREKRNPLVRQFSMKRRQFEKLLKAR